MSVFNRRPTSRASDARHLPARARLSFEGALEHVDVALICEATYPFVTGGLSAVVHQIVSGLPQLRFGIIHIAWDSNVDLVPRYELPRNVRWVHPVFTSMEEHPDFKSLKLRDLGLSKQARAQLPTRIFEAINAHTAGNDDLLWELYDEGVNPLTREFLLWPILASEEFMDEAARAFGGQATLSQLFWQLRDFVSVAYALTNEAFPAATVYHSHTTGGASLLAAAAARQHRARFMLTEHNLYTRDSINFLLQRSMANRVTANTWRELDRYEGGDLLNPEIRRVTPDQRAWMAWNTSLGHIGYRAADKITYLFPESIGEAAALGSRPDISTVIPNGVDTQPYLRGRDRVTARLPETMSPDHVWRLAFAARVVRIKGLIDLIEAISILDKRGFSNFTLDVMGPLEEEPDYAQRCRERIEELGLTDRIRLLGTVKITKTLPNYDLLVLPSYNEGVPIIILEALAIGVPVLATKVGGVSDVVAQPHPDPENPGNQIGPAGIVIEPQNIGLLADALQQVMENPAKHIQHSVNAVERAERLYHIDIALAKYADQYKALGAAAPVLPPTHPLPVIYGTQIQLQGVPRRGK